MSEKRIAINAAITYLRFVIAAGLALFSSRWILNALGHSDYGIYSLVGAVIVFLTALNSLMATSAARNFAYAIGRGENSELKNWFNAAIGIHIILAVLLVVVGWPIGEYVITHVLTIPFDRITISTWIFRISLISAFVSIFSVPFIAMFTAKQQLTQLAAWGILQALSSFILAWFLVHESGDRLLFYALGMALINVFFCVAQIVHALLIFDECRINSRMFLNRDKCKKLFSFATWNLFGWCGVLFRDQGSAILLNVFFGPSANAAYAIANQVSMQTNQFSTALIAAFSPAITTTEGEGERGRMLSLSQRASLIGTILTLLMAVPIMIEMDSILDLWLGSPPLGVSKFCQLILISFIIDRLSSGHMLAVYAHGEIAAYQVSVGLTMMSTVFIGWVIFKMGYPSHSIGFVLIFTISIVSVLRIIWVRVLFNVNFYAWIKSTVFPCAIVALAGVAFGMLVVYLLEATFYRIIITLIVSDMASVFVAWFFVLNKNNRDLVIKIVADLVRKIKHI